MVKLCSFMLFWTITSLTSFTGLSLETCSGKEEKVAMQIAIEDFNNKASHCLSLLVKSSGGDPLRAASSAKTLIKKHQVSAILGLGSWQEAALVAEIGNRSLVPTLSLANEVPIWAFQQWPFLVNAARTQFAQMKAVAGIVQSWQWRKVNVIYEDVSSALAGINPYLISALRDIGSEVNEFLPLPPLPSFHSISEKLKHLKNGQCRVFIVHTSVKLAAHIFKEAMNLGMMEREYVWITTQGITNMIDIFNASVISSMQGVLGVRSYFACSSKQCKDFRYSFHDKFHKQYPHDPRPEPGIYAIQAYDAMWAIALSFKKSFHTVLESGQKLLSRIAERNFEGLSGSFSFREGMLDPAHIFQIINVVGKSYREVGYWTEKLGFSEKIGIDGKYNNSMRILGQVFWPGGAWSVPRGWTEPINAEPLKIGIPMGNEHKEFVEIKHDNQKGNVSVKGFSIDVFRSTLSYLPYALPHIFIPFNGTYDSLVQQVKLQIFDAVVADTAIVASRCEDVGFSQPYADSGLQMVVYVKPDRLDRAWLFTKPFTAPMWIFTGVINVYNGLVVWLIERKHNPELIEGNIWNQIGTMLSSSFITLFSFKGDGLHSNLSRLAMVAWLFVALVITQSFTASLTTLLTAQQLDPVMVSVERLKESKAKVGCDGNSFVGKYLEDVLKFEAENIVRVYSGDQYADALASGKIAAAFLEVPYVKVFLAKNCKGFTTSGPTYKVGGFGFVFSRNSPYLPDISEAVVKVAESGKLKELETSLIPSYECLAADPENLGSLGLSSYWGLFVITGGTSTISLLLFGIGYIRQNWCQHLNKEQPQDPDIRHQDPDRHQHPDNQQPQDPDIQHQDPDIQHQDPDRHQRPDNQQQQQDSAANEQ